jgi:signal transduction histidine kinase
LLNIRRDAPSGALSAFRVSEWSVRRKVVLVLTIPVIAAAVFGGLRVTTEFSSAVGYSTTQQRVSVLGPAIDYLSATERIAMPAALADRMGADGAGTPDQSFAAAQNRLRQAAAGAHLTTAEKQTVASMLQLGQQFRSTGTTDTPSVALSSLARYAGQLINATAVTQGSPDPRTQALVQALNGRLSLAKQQLLLQSTGTHSQLGLAWFTAEVGVEGSALDNLKAILGNTGRVSTLGSANSERLGSATDSSLPGLAATPGMFTKYSDLSDHLLIRIDNLLAQEASASQSRALTDAGIILAALLASLLLALFVARALINPLRKVRAGALDVANVQLPETVKRIRAGAEIPEFVPIDVHTREELGQLARAVDDMHRQAVNLATGEAHLRSQVGAMFVTLSRRNTTLVNQQLALIESLEQDEEDPQRLEQLFSLDHLATRMRRTAESLVILGGTAGRSVGVEELTVSDVIHAAVSEVQDYQRVRIDGAPDRSIVGRVASDVVHLMAELIDNALAYSPPGSPVTIQAAEDGGRVEIEIIDSGLGMAGEALSVANASLTNGGEVTVDTARRMGLFVVSRLAEQHGLTVKLRRNLNGGGIIASILLPLDVLIPEAGVQYPSLMDASEEVDEPTPVPVVEEPEEEYDPYLERIEEAIAAVTGLPRRRPGLNREEHVEVPATSVGMFDAEPALSAVQEHAALEAAPEKEREAIALGPVSRIDELWAVPAEEEETLAEVVTADFGGEQSTALDDTDDEWRTALEPADVDEPLTVVDESEESDEREESDEPEHDVWADELPDETVAEADDTTDESDEPEDEPFEGDVALAPVAEPVSFAEPVSYEEPDSFDHEPSDAPIRMNIRRPLSAAPAASALEGDFVDDVARSDDSPIFGQLQSNWLGGDADEEAWQDEEKDAAWTAADRSDSAEPGVRTSTGLPVRRPGNRLVPGGVTPEPVVAVRDPEAIRNRLAAHAAGVNRGRAAATAQPATDPFQDDYSHEETGPA